MIRSDYCVSETKLFFDFYEDVFITQVFYKIYPRDHEKITDIVLNGHKTVELIDIKIDNTNVDCEIITEKNDSKLTIKNKTIMNFMETEKYYFTLFIKCKIMLEQKQNFNEKLMYVNGLQQIVFSFNSPDILSKYIVQITIDKNRFKHIISNGKIISDKIMDSDRVITWNDTYKKPSYLFNLILHNYDDSIQFSNFRIHGENKKYMKSFLDHLLILTEWMQTDIIMNKIIDNNITDLFLTDSSNYVDFINDINTYIINEDSDDFRELFTYNYIKNRIMDKIRIEKWSDMIIIDGLAYYSYLSFYHKLSDIYINMQECINISKLDYKLKSAYIIQMYINILGLSGFVMGLQNVITRYHENVVSCGSFWNSICDVNFKDILNYCKLNRSLINLFNLYL